MQNNILSNKNLFLRIVDKETGFKSKEVPLEDIIFESSEVEFEFDNGDTLPFDDFMFYSSDYDYEIIYKEV